METGTMDTKTRPGSMIIRGRIKKIGYLTGRQEVITQSMKAGGYRNYSAKAAQIDLDTLTGPGIYTIDGDTFKGYFIRHNSSGKTVIKNYSPRELVILTVDLFKTGTKI